jgi:radical SAM protein with 4Fe4S-binding SPASM domain
MKRPISYIDLKLIDKIISESKGKTELATLHAWGESILHPQFDTIIKKFKNNGIKTQLSTNGSFLDERRTILLLESGLDFLICSLDAINEETYNKQRCGGDYCKITGNIERLLALAKLTKSKTFIVLQLVYTNLNKDEVDHFREKWKNKGAHIWLKPYSTWNGEDEGMNDLYVGDQILFKENLCDWPWRQMVIHANGNVVACCNDYDGKEVLGNISQNSIDEIWNGEKMKSFRSLHIKGRDSIAFCKSCDYMSLGTIKQSVFVAFDYLKSLKVQTFVENYYKCAI